MTKKVLQITFTKRKGLKTKFGKWFYWKIYWIVWMIWRPRVMSKVYLLFLSREKRKEILKKFEEVEVIIKESETKGEFEIIEL